MSAGVDILDTNRRVPGVVPMVIHPLWPWVSGLDTTDTKPWEGGDHSKTLKDNEPADLI